MIYKLLYLPTAEYIEVPHYVYNTLSAYQEFLNNKEIRFYKSNALGILNWTCTPAYIEHLTIGNELPKHMIEIVEVNNEEV